MITFPDFDTIEPGDSPWPAESLGFTLDDRPPPAARVQAEPAGRSLFDDDFDLPPAPDIRAEPEVIEPTFTLDEYEAARTDAYRAGHAAARAEAEASIQAADRAMMAKIAASLDTTREDAARAAEDAAEAIGQLLLDTLAALFPALCARFGETEAQALTRAIVPVLRQEQRATIRVSPVLIQPIADMISRIDPDLIPRIDFQPDPDLLAGDIRIIWRNGEARRDCRALWSEIGDILGQAGWPVAPIPQPAMKETANVE